jgi:hypothetical protein
VQQQQGNQRVAEVVIEASLIPADLLEFFEPVNPDALTDVFKVATRPYKGAHFATFPPALIEPCILAGTSEAGCCRECGKPWERVVERTHVKHPKAPGRNGRQACKDGGAVSAKSMFRTGLVPITKTTGFRPACSCDAGDPVPCTVLDPFAGAFTTGTVAKQHGRSFIGIELNPAYLEMGRERLANT